ncbi:lactate/malate family dehydrogenase [Solimonas marina]|uniref:Lactate dehydrogenase n=1 Tax=Solimonas marina TaxID=2714601 RepID=A0A969WCX4_9GAMM|nr:lactate dehydrogenase [Solimonas marina]
MDIAIVGANGDVGRQLAVQIVGRRLLTPRARLQLIGRRGGASERALHGLRADLYDAFAEITPEIDVGLAPEDVAADLILFAAGATPAASPHGSVDRRELAKTNRAVFESYARSLAQRGHGEEIVVVVTNPVELGVSVFARHLDPHRVIGMGAYQDSMRLRREIATDLGVRRQRVQAYALGEHGDALVPILSRVWIYGFDDAENALARDRLRGGRSVAAFAERLASEKQVLRGFLADNRVAEAFLHAEALPADLRAVLMPVLTHVSGAKTAVSTASVTTELVETILSGGQSVIPAQVQLGSHDWFGPPGVLGVPVMFGLRGWSRPTDLDMDDDEHRTLLDVAARIQRQIEDWSRD